jgi:RNA polymerase sigma-70 factor (ECF subfamily)
MCSVEEDTRGIFEAGRAEHPDVELDPLRFAERLAARPELSGSRRAGDLYLAIGCELGDPRALAALEARVLPDVRASLRRVVEGEALVDELLQEVRVRALVGAAGSPPRIAGYAGGGSLAGWLKVMARRILIDRRREVARLGEADLDEHEAANLAPDRALLDAEWGPRLRAALRAALLAQTARDRTLLRLHYVDGLPLGRIGAMYGRDKATISRWLSAARERLLASMIEAAGSGHGHDAFVSLCRQIVSRLEVSLSALHGQEGEVG